MSEIKYKDIKSDYTAFSKHLDTNTENVMQTLKEKMGDELYAKWLQFSLKYGELIKQSRVTEANSLKAKFEKENG